MAKRKYADINRQEIRLEPKGKFLKDEVSLEELGLNTGEFQTAVIKIYETIQCVLLLTTKLTETQILWSENLFRPLELINVGLGI